MLSSATEVALVVFGLVTCIVNDRKRSMDKKRREEKCINCC
jgi:hypothetical protein